MNVGFIARILLDPPGGAVGETIRFARAGLDGNAVTRLCGRHIAAALHDDRVLEVLVQMIDIFDDPSLHRPRYRDEVEHRQMLHVLAEPNAAGMRTHRYAELRGHQDDRQILVHTAEAAAVDL